MKTSQTKITFIDVFRLFVLLIGIIFVYSLLESFMGTVGWIASILIAIIICLLVYPIIKQRNYDRQQQHILYDSLTCLPTRTLFQTMVTETLHTEIPLFALLIVDIDNFKYINESVGHAGGDYLLTDISNRIHSVISESSILARIGEDEFGILIPDLGLDTEYTILVENIAQRIVDCVHKPLEYKSQVMYLSVSIGVTICSSCEYNFDEIMNQATSALRQAKANGRNGYFVYTCEGQMLGTTRLELQNALYKALDDNEFELYYQPQINTETNAMIGAEALVRWEHPTMGKLSPAVFIPIAEDTNLIVKLGECLLLMACKECRKWHDAGYMIKVSVNLSTRQILTSKIIDHVCNALRASGLPATYLDLEITESVAFENLDKTINTLKELKALGVSISIDDFGTGYSSLSYLKNLPIDIIKIDQSFIKEITTDESSAPVVFAIIQMAKALQLSVVAEGVETVDQLYCLQRKGCNIIQGYLISKPLPADEFYKIYINPR